MTAADIQVADGPRGYDAPAGYKATVALVVIATAGLMV